MVAWRKFTFPWAKSRGSDFSIVRRRLFGGLLFLAGRPCVAASTPAVTSSGMSEWIDVSDISPRIAYTATASQTAFTVPFVFFSNSDLNVYQNAATLTLNTHYTVTGAEDEDGGTVTLVTGATVGDEILITRHVPVEQTTHIPPSGPLDIPAINVQISKLVAMIQQQADQTDRAVHLPDNDSTLSAELASAATRANKLLGFDTNGDLIYPLGPDFVGSTSTGVAEVDSRATAQVTTFDVSVNVVRTAGLATPGDGGGTDYVRGLVGDPGAFQDAGAVYWKFASDRYGVADVESQVTAALKRYPSSVSIIATRGLTTPGDGGGRTYKRGIVTDPGAFADVAGVYWVYDTPSSTSSSGFAGVGDDTFDNLTTLQAAITAAGWRGNIELPVGTFYVSAAPTNPKGVTFSGPGYISINDANGSRYRWDQRGSSYPEIEGREYLGPYHHIIRTQSIGAMTYEFIGDSTFVMEPESGFNIPKLIQANMLWNGLAINSTAFNNRAISGVTTAQMRSVQAPLSIAANPDILFIHPGMNDVYIMAPTAGIRTDAQILAGAEIMRASLDGMLADIRAGYHHLRLTIVLMTPNSSSLYTGGDDERYFETVSPMVRTLARKYRCVFFDTYRIWRDSRDMGPSASGGTIYPWMDEPFLAGQGSQHPAADFNVQISDMLTGLLAPVSIRRLKAAPILSTPRAIASLPTANAVLKGARGFVTDANAAFASATIGGVVASGGANAAPVYCDGTNWRYG